MPTKPTKMQKFYMRELNQLKGGEMTRPFYNDDGYFGMLFLMPNGDVKYLTFLCDDEGNGPGSFEIGDFI